MENNKLLASKIIKVMSAIKSVSKDGFNAFHKYKYVTDAAIVAEIREKMIASNLICVPSQTSCVTVGELTTLRVEYTLIDADSGESMTVGVFGYGHDKGDKGVYKAATGAEKYFLLKTFLLPTDDDPENDKGSVEEDMVQVARVPAGYWDLNEKDRQARIGAGNIVKKTKEGWFIFSQKADGEKWKAAFEKTKGQFTNPPLGAKE